MQQWESFNNISDWEKSVFHLRNPYLTLLILLKSYLYNLNLIFLILQFSSQKQRNPGSKFDVVAVIHFSLSSISTASLHDLES